MPRYLVGIAAAVGAYALWPLDLIPDFIPLLGYADDAALVPLGIFLAAKLHKTRAGDASPSARVVSQFEARFSAHSSRFVRVN